MLGVGLMAGCYEGRNGDSAYADDSPEDQDEGEAPALECDAIGGQPLRRLSSTQYEQILLDLLPDGFAQQAVAASSFPRTVIDGGFSTYASANRVSTNASMRIEDNAEAIAELFLANAREIAPVLVPCLPTDYTPSDVDACVGEFVEAFGERAFRRPLTEAEQEIVLRLYDEVARADGANTGLAAVLQYFLQAPALLYVVERAGTGGELYVPLSPHELATRLALLFTNSAPDDELLADGDVDGPDGLAGACVDEGDGLGVPGGGLVGEAVGGVARAALIVAGGGGERTGCEENGCEGGRVSAVVGHARLSGRGRAWVGRTTVLGRLCGRAGYPEPRPGICHRAERGWICEEMSDSRAWRGGRSAGRGNAGMGTLRRWMERALEQGRFGSGTATTCTGWSRSLRRGRGVRSCWVGCAWSTTGGRWGIRTGMRCTTR